MQVCVHSHTFTRKLSQALGPAPTAASATSKVRSIDLWTHQYNINDELRNSKNSHDSIHHTHGNGSHPLDVWPQRVSGRHRMQERLQLTALEEAGDDGACGGVKSIQPLQSLLQTISCAFK